MSKYTDWVKKHDCRGCLAPADDPHHIRGLGGIMGGKNDDITCIPLCRKCHSLLHSGNLELNEYKEMCRMILKAVSCGKVKYD